jgi:hypothetical protein
MDCPVPQGIKVLPGIRGPQATKVPQGIRVRMVTPVPTVQMEAL